MLVRSIRLTVSTFDRRFTHSTNKTFLFRYSNIEEDMAGARARRRERQLKRLQRKNQRDAEIKDGTRVETIREAKSWDAIVKDNPAFEAYYRHQGIVKDEQEFQEMMSSLRSPLNASFRITSYFGGQAAALKKIVKSPDFTDLMTEGGGDSQVRRAIECLSWYPGDLAYQLNVSRIEIRKSETLQRLHNFLLSETESGYISRQEAVSMIPPLVLDVKPHHKILDMCAAPGSKTAQLIEMLHDSRDGTSEGVVIANDIDNKRCYMLVHQAKRLHSPSCIITNHDSSVMPSFYEKDQDGSMKEVKFDRVLCDVPCSGDGTLRKNTEVWKAWNPANGNNFHGIQLKIAKRGLEMLAKDGLMAYSTCSLNPQEDEAVVATLLRESKGGVELVDVSHVMPNLKYKPGLQTWTVMTRQLEPVDSISKVEEKYKTQIRESMFPPKDEGIKDQLTRCLRILPHLQDTGGFFVAVFRKTVDDLKWDSSANGSSTTEAHVAAATIEPPSKKPKFDKKLKTDAKKGFREDPFIFFSKDAQEWPEMKTFYKINDNFPFEQLMYRNSEGRKRNIYFLTKAAKQIIQDNEDRIRFVNAGARLFSRNTEKDFDCDYRLTQDGLPSVYPFIDPESTILLSFDDMKNLLKEDNYPMEKLSEGVKTKVMSLSIGSCILLFKTTVDETEVTVPLCGWRGLATLRPYIAKNERMHFLRICGVDPKELEAENRQQFIERQERRTARLNRELESRKQAQEASDAAVVQDVESVAN